VNIAQLTQPPEAVLEHGPVAVYKLGAGTSDQDETHVLDLVGQRYERAYALPNAPSIGLDRYVAKARIVDASLRNDSKAWLAAVADGTVIGHLRYVRRTESNVLPMEEEFGLTLDPHLRIAEWGRFISEHHPEVPPHGASLPILQAVTEDAIENEIRYMVASMTEHTHSIMQRFGMGHTRFSSGRYRQIWYQATWTIPTYWRVPDEIDLLTPRASSRGR
jgi:hypothetical protein